MPRKIWVGSTFFMKIGPTDLGKEERLGTPTLKLRSRSGSPWAPDAASTVVEYVGLLGPDMVGTLIGSTSTASTSSTCPNGACS